MSTCLNCAHEEADHQPLEIGSYVTDDGVTIRSLLYGVCTHVDPDLLSECGCEGWIPDELPLVTDLLGLAARRVIL